MLGHTPPSRGEFTREDNGPTLPGSPSLENQPPDTDLHPVLYRLKWSILDEPSEIQFLEVGSEGEPQWLPLFGNSRASTTEAAATEPPVSHLQIRLDPMDTWEFWGDFLEKPSPLVIENGDGRHISITQFIHAVREYAVPLRNLLCRTSDIYGPANCARARFYLHDISAGSDVTPERPYPELYLNLAKHVDDEDDDDLADIWETIEIVYRNQLNSE
ncbi:hypothetical protein BDW02DRAFT_538593 [Decorospora gaudefroyi]|uniref:Uncharacterized protein n=1 Tax=Decorospora gaudefroyi TaxID=184978 RepID=A0A6A5K415_9PLEO|nr:hypothetical protein BDW02DRAFT_538593 [Decorospora gaudefroyi]